MKRKNETEKGMGKKKWKGLYILIGVVFLCLIGTTGYLMMKQVQRNRETKAAAAEMNARSSDGSGETSKTKDNEIVYQGETYTYNRDLRTVLFMGVDKHGDLTKSDVYGRNGQSDCLILLVMNKNDKTTEVIEISRDTMTDVDVYSMEGNFIRTIKAQIATQYSYGDGEKRSCQFTKDVVSNLMYGIPIQSYVALDISGISAIVDSMGGVQITVPEDYTSVDPAFVKGSDIVLTGAQAEKYVRYRDINEFGSNNQRMERQTQFIRAFFPQMKGIQDYDKILNVAEPYMATDIDAEMLKSLSEYEMNEEVRKVEGENKMGQEHDEFYVDDEALYELILDVFYVKKQSK